MKGRFTAYDVAKLANVSQSAVSRAFTKGASVAPSTRARILAAAEQLGYHPNAMARSLTTSRSRIIGLVMSYLDNQFYPLVIERLSQALQRDGYHLLLFISETGDADVFLPDILQYQVEGIVLASTALSSSLAQNCSEAGVPVVLFNRVAKDEYEGRFAPSSVTSDNFGGAKRIGELLVQSGHKKISYLAGFENSSTSQLRESGLLEALVEAGMKLHSRAVGGYDFAGAQAAVRSLFQSGSERPDALFVANDHMAMAALETLRSELKLKVPGDVSLVGFDDVPQATWPSFALTTVRQDVDAMVSATKKLLFDQLKGEVRPLHVHVPCTVVERETARFH